MTVRPDRRTFCRQMAAGAGLALSCGIHFSRVDKSMNGEPRSGGTRDNAPDAELNLLTNPKYEVGAKLRLAQFIRRGADAKEGETIFRRLTDLTRKNGWRNGRSLRSHAKHRVQSMPRKERTRRPKSSSKKHRCITGLRNFR